MLAVFIHEAGHVIAARCMGIPVYAWGIGYRRPWYYHRFRTTTFYLGFPLGSGLTVPCHPMQDRRPFKHCVLLLGGPLATILGLIVGLSLWPIYGESPLLWAWLYVSSIVAFLSTVPIKSISKSLPIGNDAHQILDCLIYKRQAPAVRPGSTLQSLRVLADLLDNIECRVGFGYVHASIAVFEAMLGNIDLALQSLFIAHKFQYYDGNWVSIAAYADLLVAVKENSDITEERFAIVAKQCQSNSTVNFSIECIRQQWRHANGFDVKDEIGALRQRAVAATRMDLLCIADQMAFEFYPCDRAASRCRELLHTYRRYISSIDKARLLAVTTEWLAVNGELDLAHTFFAEAQTAIADEAATIKEDTTRQAFVRVASEPLNRAGVGSGLHATICGCGSK